MATHFPQSFIQKIKDSTDMLKLAEMYTSEPMKKTGEGIYQARCPHPAHKDDTPSFTVWSKLNSWTCYGCHSGKKSSKDHNYGSDCIAFIQWIENCSWREAVLKLAEINNIPKPNSENEKEYNIQFNLASKYHKDLLENSTALEYLYNRGLDKKAIKDFMLGFDGEKITFPLLDRFKNVLGFTRRWINPPQGCSDKYRNSATSKIFDKSKYFYGIHKLDMSKRYIRITEGPMDVIKPTQYGASNVVATLGTAFTEEHAKIIKRLGLIPVLVYDGDSAGLKAMNKAASLLAQYNVFCQVIILPQGKDLADITSEIGEFIEDYLKSESKPYGYYKAESLVAEYNAKMYELKLEMIPKIENILKDVPEKERNIINSFLTDELKIKI